MSTLHMQTAIAKICVDRSFRRLFQRAPDDALASLDLTSTEAAIVKAIDFTAIDTYAESLVAKRTVLIARWFAMTLGVLRRAVPRGRYHQILQDYGFNHIRESDDVGGDYVRGEFTDFRRHFRQLLDSGELSVPGLSDVFEFEATRVWMGQDREMSRCSIECNDARRRATVPFAGAAAGEARPRLGGHVCIRRFACNVVDLIGRIEDDLPLPAIDARETWLMFVKKPKVSLVTTQVLSGPLKDLLVRCDGTQTTDEIVGGLVSEYCAAGGVESADVDSDCRSILDQFYTAGLIHFAQPASEGAVAC